MATCRLFVASLVACILLSQLHGAQFFSVASSSAFSTSASSSGGNRKASFFVDWRTARSLLNNLLQRIENNRLARGDVLGVERIRHLRSSVTNAVTFWKNAGSITLDYLIHYSWRYLSTSQITDILRLAGELQSAIVELLQLQSELERMKWISDNYDHLLEVAKTAIQKLLSVFVHEGATRNFILTVQKEILGGDILRDALQLAASDLRSLIQVATDMFWRNYGPPSSGVHPDL